MTETAKPAPADGIHLRPKSDWDVGVISATLRCQPEVTRDIAHGPGVRYTLGEQDALTLELFPPHAERSKGIVRVSTADSLQEFYRQPQPALREEGLVFETTNLLISLSPAGELMTYRVVPDDISQEPNNTSDDAEERLNPESNDDESGYIAAPPARVIQQGLPEAKEGQPRVSHGGRLGTEPRTKTTPKGTFIMEFPVAVQVEGREKADWRTTVVFDERARKLAADDTLHKGTYVDVIAYEHVKQHKAQDGTPREVKEYYATSVTPKSRNRQESSGARSEPAQQ